MCDFPAVVLAASARLVPPRRVHGRRLFAALAAAVALGGVATGCGRSDSDYQGRRTAPPTTAPPPTAPPPTVATVPPPGVPRTPVGKTVKTKSGLAVTLTSPKDPFSPPKKSDAAPPRERWIRFRVVARGTQPRPPSFTAGDIYAITEAKKAVRANGTIFGAKGLRTVRVAKGARKRGYVGFRVPKGTKVRRIELRQGGQPVAVWVRR